MMQSFTLILSTSMDLLLILTKMKRSRSQVRWLSSIDYILFLLKRMNE